MDKEDGIRLDELGDYLKNVQMNYFADYFYNKNITEAVFERFKHAGMKLVYLHLEFMFLNHCINFYQNRGEMFNAWPENEQKKIEELNTIVEYIYDDTSDKMQMIYSVLTK